MRNERQGDSYDRKWQSKGCGHIIPKGPCHIYKYIYIYMENPSKPHPKGGLGVRLHAAAGRGSSAAQRLGGLEVARGTKGPGSTPRSIEIIGKL